MERDEFIRTFLKISLHRIRDLYYGKLKAALMTVSYRQLWMPAYPGANSIGGIVFHLCEHLRTSEMSLRRLEAKFRDDFVTYFPEQNLQPSEVLDTIDRQIRSWQEAMMIYIEGRSKTEIEDVHDLYNLVEHISYHLGQIIDKIQEMNKMSFNFYSQGLNERFLREKIEG